MGEWVLGDVDTVAAWDAAYCPPEIPALSVAMPYIGGSSADHVWPDDDLARVERSPRLPIWVPTPGVDDPRRVAGQCAARLRELGVPPINAAGRHQRVMFDLETGTEPDPRWLTIARGRMLQAGYYLLPYGSASWLLEYDPCAGFVVADPTGVPHMYLHPNVVGTQWCWNVALPRGGSVNQSLFLAGIVSALWLPKTVGAAA